MVLTALGDCRYSAMDSFEGMNITKSDATSIVHGIFNTTNRTVPNTAPVPHVSLAVIREPKDDMIVTLANSLQRDKTSEAVGCKVVDVGTILLGVGVGLFGTVFGMAG